MDNSTPFKGVDVPADIMSTVNGIAVVILIPVFEKLVYPLFKKLGFPLSTLRRFTFGFILTICAFIAAVSVITVYSISFPVHTSKASCSRVQCDKLTL